ncbi:LacI family DNA-binding transcriptional regulator [Isoptericola sp. 4D.3]|uniref:LacI family DNA-binding transcriptional regulator n=1 Tax=Isoptericola peretonis TaxID=2918523 RepID=A0ABT0J519_9MICO|nr:LacI family DNA-binding transcriptional regulator [Isoptericola sp. 4D.3]
MPTSRRRPTVKDVAAEAGVGAMTVSYTFNRPERVAETTRAKVLAAAERLGYRPDSTARALRSGRTGQIGVVLGEHLSYAFDDPQATTFLAGVADVCVEEGMGMVLIPTHGDASDTDRVLAAAVDAYVLWTTTDDDPVLDSVARSGRPASIQGGPESAGITRIGQDERAAARALAGTALDHGSFPVVISFPLDKRRIPAITDGGALSDRPVAFPVTRARLAGYADAVTSTGRDWGTTPVAVVGRNRRAEADTAMRDLLQRVPLGASPVVLAMSDELALGARSALDHLGRTALLAGWDASAEALSAQIITVTNPLREQGRLCARAALHPGASVEPVPWRILGPGDARPTHRTS